MQRLSPAMRPGVERSELDRALLRSLGPARDAVRAERDAACLDRVLREALVALVVDHVEHALATRAVRDERYRIAVGRIEERQAKVVRERVCHELLAPLQVPHR